MVLEDSDLQGSCSLSCRLFFPVELSMKDHLTVTKTIQFITQNQQ